MVLKEFWIVLCKEVWVCWEALLPLWEGASTRYSTSRVIWPRECGILGYALVHRERTPAYKIKIEAHLLPDSLVSARDNGCFPDVWLGSSGFNAEGPLLLHGPGQWKERVLVAY